MRDSGPDDAARGGATPSGGRSDTADRGEELRVPPTAAEDYGALNPGWHEEDAPHKAHVVAELLARLGLTAASVADVGCGTGEVLRRLKDTFDADGRWPRARWQGWDIAAEAIERARAREDDRLRFVQGDFTVDGPRVDLILCLDTFEHVGDDVAFLRALAARAPWLLLRIPLELSALDVLRPHRLLAARAQWGHRHAYTRALAFAVLEEAGLEVVGWQIDRVPPEVSGLRGRLVHAVRSGLFAVAPEVTVAVLGGFSLLVVCRPR